MAAPLVVGFDLDMTLIDTVPGFGAVLRVLGAELGVEFPVEEMTSRLGPPLELMLAPYLPSDEIPAAGDRFRALYPDHAVASVPLLPGAADAIAAVRRHGGRVLVVTGKYPANARLHLEHLALEVDHLEGWVWGVGKADVLRREGAAMYVGDHVHDVEGAQAAGVLSVSVLTVGARARSCSTRVPTWCLTASRTSRRGSTATCHRVTDARGTGAHGRRGQCRTAR